MPASRKTLFVAFSITLLPFARACGPDFPNAYLAEGSVSLLNAPEGYFAAEIAKLAPVSAPDKAKARADSATESLIVAANAAKRANELTETGVLRLELAKRGLSQARIDALAAELETVRANIFAKAWDKIPTFSADMPVEFAFYLNGAFAYWKGDFAGAHYHWMTLLALPENERRHYTVNAAYMLGRINFSDDRITWLRKTREAAAAGFDDLSDLATASLGWEARAWLDTGDSVKAIHLYMQQYAVGDEAAAQSATQSLRMVASGALSNAAWWGTHSCNEEIDTKTAASLQALAQDELARRVVTVYLLARFGTSRWEPNDTVECQSRAWAEILQKAGLDNVPDADRIAWIAYQAGYFDMAEKWVALATQDSVPANWIRAKLALRDGNLADGERLLKKVAANDDLTSEARPVAWSELGRVRMSRGEYADALDAFLRGGHWEDSAYIAERVLTLDELRVYVDRHCPEYTDLDKENDPEISCHDSYWTRGERASRNALRHLLARRLARANQPETAAKYFPEGDLREAYTDYIADVRQGFDATLPAEKRARAFWRAALVIHENGMELLGTELAPDYFIWDGSYEGSAIVPMRQGRLRLEAGPAAPTADELARLEKNTVPEKRFHYRYRAAELGMWAASLMPNDNDETAAMLNTAGRWLKARDPKAANVFYRVLVIRCPNTALGKAAVAKKWFSGTEGNQQ